ncbi:RNA-directed DNA polymerase [uncultured Pedobacter sp.]|uniref:RNA-directed DNA polymerase n=1 Tax=uncultured Pedobacter sp. TaxID=246139 RepID=UPI0025F749A1|nr:RNA-directed DNA polymerase [uncultured Pedobacter sp.]
MDLRDQFLHEDNFYSAFKKIKSFLNQANEWYDPIALVIYEANLHENVARLVASIQDKSYRSKKIQPLPFPKKSINENHQMRPYFYVDFDDQLVAAAIANVIGDQLEAVIPVWSYGNRLYRPIWYEDFPGGTKKLHVGSCQNRSANFYRTWKQSWPRYKRHISMTIKLMSKKNAVNVEDFDDPIEQKIFQEAQDDNFRTDSYLDQKMWKSINTDELYWAALDFKKFFPSVNVKNIITNARTYLVKPNGEPRDDVDLIIHTLEKLLFFEIDSSGWDIHKMNQFLNVHDNSYIGLPTGLIAAGFFANISMLDIDIEMDRNIKQRKDTAIFKYVDDHVLISQSREGLFKVLNEYISIIESKHPEIKIQEEKIEPKDYIEFDGVFKWKSEGPVLQVQYPEPLMTSTLQKISALDQIDVDLMNPEELAALEADLKQLVLTPLPGTEIKEDTKISFAAGKICRIGMQLRPDSSKVDPYSIKNGNALQHRAQEVYRDKYKQATHNSSEKKKLLKAITTKIAIDIRNENFLIEKNRLHRQHERLFNLLLKSLRENPDKIKLWRRAIQFCAVTGYDGLQKLIDLIALCKLDKESVIFVRSFCYLSIQLYFERAISIVSEGIALFWEVSCSWDFRQHVLALSVSENLSRYPFERIAIDNLKSIVAVGREISNDAPHSIAWIGSISVDRIDRPLMDDTNTLIGNHNEGTLWYAINRISWPDKRPFVNKYFDRIDFRNPISWALITSFPDLITAKRYENILNYLESTESINSKIQNLISKDSYLSFEIFKGLAFKKNSFLHRFPIVSQKLQSRIDKYIALDDYIHQLSTNDTHSQEFNVKLSEWSLLEILIQVIRAGNINLNRSKRSIRDKFSRPKIENYYIHPSNILIPESWLKTKVLDWASWKQTVKKQRIKLTELKARIHDDRYSPMPTTFLRSMDLHLIIGYSLLLVKLSSHSFLWPSTTASVYFLDKLFSHARQTMENEAFSSNSRIFLNAIFSGYKADEIFDYHIELAPGIILDSLGNFQQCLKALQHSLEDHQMHIAGRAPRQMIYVSIDDLQKPTTQFFKETCEIL